MFVTRGIGKSDDNFLARLREEASYCDFEKPRIGGFIKTFISGFREPEAKFRPLECINAKTAMLVTETTKSLQFRNQAMAFGSSSSASFFLQ